MGVLLLGTRRLKGLVKPAYMVFNLVTTAVLFQGSIENCVTTRLDVLFIVKVKDSVSPQEIQTSSSAPPQ